jgi:hypothetical protein
MLCSLADVDISGELATGVLEEAAAMTERIADSAGEPWQTAAGYIRRGDPAVIACARNRAKGLCPMRCDQIRRN